MRVWVESIALSIYLGTAREMMSRYFASVAFCRDDDASYVLRSRTGAGAGERREGKIVGVSFPRDGDVAWESRREKTFSATDHRHRHRQERARGQGRSRKLMLHGRICTLTDLRANNAQSGLRSGSGKFPRTPRQKKQHVCVHLRCKYIRSHRCQRWVGIRICPPIGTPTS